MTAPKKTTPGKSSAANPKAVTQKITPTPEVKTVKAVVAAPAAPKPVTVSAAATQPIKTAATPAPAKHMAKTLSQAEWRSLVEQAAYYVAEKNGFSGNPEEHWAAAEAQVRAELAGKNIRVA